MRVASISALLFLIAIGLGISPGVSQASQLGFSGTFQYTKQSSAAGGGSIYSFTPGLRAAGDSWYTTVYLPVALNNATSSTQVTGTQSSMSGGMGGLQPAIGDLFASAGVSVISESGSVPAVWVTGQGKAPIGSSGTGEWDFATGLSLRKSFSAFFLTADASFLKVGNPPGGSYQKGLFYGVGGGTIFGQGALSLLMYFQGASAIQVGEPGQRQLSTGLNIALSSSSFVTTIISKGFTDSSPAFTGSVGYTTYY